MTPEELANEKTWWEHIVYREDGTLDEEKVLAELADWRFALHEVSRVYATATCGQLSKLNYYAYSVIETIEACQTRAIKTEVIALLDDLEAGNTSISELRGEYQLDD